MYTPQKAVNLKDVSFVQYRVGIVGAPGSGKTYSALTFPNPVVADFDNGLAAHKGKNIPVAPFYSDTFCDSLYPRKNPRFTPNRREAFTTWLKTEGVKLEEDQTLIIDSWTTLQDAFDIQSALEPVITDKGKIDEFAPWQKKIEWSRDVMVMLSSLRCNVVVTFHESQVRDKNSGILLDKIAPLMQGKFVAKIALYFNEFYRMKNIKDGANIRYLWQIKSDNDFNAKTRITTQETVIEAHFNKLKEMYEKSST